MVEDVLQLPPELQRGSLPFERDILEERDVPAVRAGQPDDVFRRIPEIAARRARKDRGVEPAGDVALAAINDRVARDDDARAVAASGDVGALPRS